MDDRKSGPAHFAGALTNGWLRQTCRFKVVDLGTGGSQTKWSTGPILLNRLRRRISGPARRLGLCMAPCASSGVLIGPHTRRRIRYTVLAMMLLPRNACYRLWS